MLKQRFLQRPTLRITKGKGIDVVLSAQSGEIAYQNFSSLAPYGIYLDISKEDIMGNAPLDMKSFNHNLSYITVDIDRMLIEKKEKIAELLQDVVDYLATDVLDSLPASIFSIDHIFEAFNQIKDNKLPGNVVIEFSNKPVAVVDRNEGSVQAEGTYLITGGTRGLGLEISKWLVEKGAKNLALLSRSGLKSTSAKLEIEQLRKKGIKVCVYAADISKFDEVERVFNKIEKELPKLVGIFHGAMVLDDGYLLDMNEERFMKVLKPKVDGAMNLHHLSKDFIGFVIKEKPTQIGFFDLNWGTISKSFGKSGVALFSEIDKMDTQKEESFTEKQIINRDKLSGLNPSAQHEFIVTLLQQQLGKILKIPITNINPDKGINLLGVDSILTIEFMGMIKESLAVEMAPIEFLTGPSVRQLSTKIIENSFQVLSEELI